MQRPRQQFLTGTTLAEQQGRDVGRRNFLDHAADGEHAFARSDDAVERRFVDLALQLAVLGFELGILKARSTSNLSVSVSTGFS